MTPDHTAACAGHSEPLWDANVDGETEIERANRHARGLDICARCPVRSDCLAEVNPKTDDGVRGGRVLPTILDRDRRSPYPVGFPPEREGRVPEDTPAALTMCDDCGKWLGRGSMPRHRQTVHRATRERRAKVA